MFRTSDEDFIARLKMRRRSSDDGILPFQKFIVLHTIGAVEWSRIALDILNLPNETYWKVIVLSSCIMNFLLGILVTFVVPEILHEVMFVYVVFDLIYLMDTILNLLHKVWKKLKLRIHTLDTSWLTLVIGFATILPQEWIFQHFISENALLHLRWVTYLRLRQLVIFYEFLDDVIEYRFALFIMCFMMMCFLITHFATCLWYHLSCVQPYPYNCDNEQTAAHWGYMFKKEHPYYYRATTSEWYQVSFYHVMEMFMTLGFGDIKPLVRSEQVMFVIVMLFGFLTINVVLPAYLIKLLTIDKQYQVVYNFKVASIMEYLKNVDVAKPVVNKIKTYYSMLWQQKKGVKSAKYFDMLPHPLQMEIMYDINCALLNRSVLFQDMKEFYLRTLSLLVTNEFLLPGDILYYQGVVKTNMLIVSKGILEVLSDEDDESPIIAFKPGTVLGESCLFMSLPAKATVRAAVYTEIHMINRIDFMRVMVHYPVTYKHLREVVIKRINTAKVLHKETDDIFSSKKNFIPIKVLKQRLMDIRRTEKGLGVLFDKDEQSTKRFCDSFLPLYVISTINSNIEAPVVCLTENFPWIIDSKSTLIYSWKCLVFLVHVIFTIVYPYTAIFQRDFVDITFLSAISGISNGVCVVDVLFLLVSTVHLRDRVLVTFRDILAFRMKAPNLYINIVSSYPYHFFLIAAGESTDTTKYYSLFTFLRILRFLRCLIIMKEIEDEFYFNQFRFKIFKSIFYFCFIVYSQACMFYYLACNYDICIEDSWFYELMVKGTKNQTAPCYLYVVESALYFSANIVTGTGTGDILPSLPHDMWAVVMCLFFASLVLIYALTHVSTSTSVEYIIICNYKKAYYQFERFLAQYRIPQYLRKEVKQFFIIQWKYDRGMGRVTFQETAPTYLKTVVYREELRALLICIPLFKNVDVDLLMELTYAARVQVLPANFNVCYSGDIDREMFIVQKGMCVVYNVAGKIMRFIGPGDYFGDIEMLFGFTKKYSVRTVTDCKIVSFSYGSYRCSLSMFTQELQINDQVMNDPNIRDKLHQLDVEKVTYEKMGKGATSKVRRVQLKELVKKFFKNSFTFCFNVSKRTRGREKYWEPFRQWGKLQVFGVLLIPITIKPNGYFLRIWLLMRFVILLTGAPVLPLILGLPPSGFNYLFLLKIAEITAYMDIYMMFHVSFYDERGILIAHPCRTSIYYLTHGFIIDFIGTFPLYYVMANWKSEDNNNGVVTQAVDVLNFSDNKWRCTMMLQYHRVIEAIFFVRGRILSKISDYVYAAVVPLLLVVLLLCTVVALQSCHIDFGRDHWKNDVVMSSTRIPYEHGDTTSYGILKCERGSWIETSSFRDLEPSDVLLLALYWYLTNFVVMGLGDITPHEDGSMLSCIVINFVGLVSVAYLLSFLTNRSDAASRDVNEYQQKVQELLNFLHHENLSKDFIDKVFAYFEYVWRRTARTGNKDLLQTLNTALVEDTVEFMYEKTLREVPLFENVERSFIRVFAKSLREQYFQKGDVLMKCYNVQNNIYIILRGKVDVLTAYGDMVSCIAVGGIFGNIHSVSAGCSAVTMVASRTVDVLMCSSETFFNILKEYPRVQKNMDAILKNAGDFIMPTVLTDDDAEGQQAHWHLFSDLTDEEKDFEVIKPLRCLRCMRKKGERSNSDISQNKQESSIASSAGTSTTFDDENIKDSFFNACCLLIQPAQWFTFALKPDHPFFIVCWYLTFIVAYYQMLVIPFYFLTQTSVWWLVIICYIGENIFYFRIIGFLHTAYIDHNGVYVTSPLQIRRRYFSSYNKPFWDIVPNIPFWAFAFFAEENWFQWYTTLRLFQLLRAKYIFEFFEWLETPLMANRNVTKLLLLMSFLIILLHYLALVFFCMCARGTLGDFSETYRPLMRNATNMDNYFTAVYFTANLLTSCGVGDVSPVNISEVIFVLVCILCNRILWAYCVVNVMQVIDINTQLLLNYEYKIMNLKNHLRNQNLSDHQMDKLNIYIRKMWKTENGSHIPELLENAPYVLKCDIMKEIFSEHLRTSYLFTGIHDALLGQICGHFRRLVLFPGNYIVQQGDTNACLYIVHRGEVSVLTVHSNLTETMHETLYPNDMFGITQGFFYGVPHHFWYRAETHCAILSLNLQEWEGILEHFPSDKLMIYTRLHNVYGIL